MSASRNPAANMPGRSRVVIGSNRCVDAAVKSVLKIGVNRHLGEEARKAEQARLAAIHAAAQEADDKRLLEAAARVTRPSIFTRHPAPRDISAESPAVPAIFYL